jgi:chromosome segregation ATPase
MQLQQRISELE